jgi:hypothetical protein
MRGWGGRSLVVVALLAASAAAAGEDDDDGDDADDWDKPERVDEHECPLGTLKPVKGTLEVVVGRESCGSMGCSNEQYETVHDADGEALIGVHNREGDFEGPPLISLDCDAGKVEAKRESVRVSFSYDAKRRALQLPPALRKQIARARVARAKGGAADERALLAELLEGVVDPPRKPDEAPSGRPILGVDYTDVQALWLAVVRDEIDAGDWTAAEETLQKHVTGTHLPPLPPAIAREHAAVQARWAALRRQSAPVVVTARHRIGSTLAWPYTALDVGFPPGIFWRKGSFCVAQEDRKPPVEMRCLDPVTRKWAPREPLDKPRGGGETLRSIHYAAVDQCDGDFVVQQSVPETEKTVCGGAPGEDDKTLVAVVDGDALMVESGYGLRLNRGPKKNQTLTWTQAAALFESSAGTYLAGNGCCRFLADGDGRLARLGDHAKRWEVRGAPPDGERWMGTPLVSPSQDWAVAFSHGKAPATTLWLLRLKRAQR